MSLLRASILGGVDGVITSFAIVSGSHAGKLGNDVVVVIGVSSLLADGFSMGISEFLSSDTVKILLDTKPKASTLGVVCFLSFVVCGFVPLAVFFLTRNLLSVSMFALVELMILGSTRTRFSGEDVLKGFFQTTLLGAAAGGIAYAVGYAMKQLIDS